MAFLLHPVLAVAAVCGLAIIPGVLSECGKNALELGGKCFCATNLTWTPLTCTKTQDCDYYEGCQCKRRECKCGNIYCPDVGKCNDYEDKCECGSELCEQEEECYMGLCMCDKIKLLKCDYPFVCKNKECHCGDRPCTEFETCLTHEPHFCFCGSYTQQCGANEVCSYDGTTYSCKCGNEICQAGETCEIENGQKMCKCGGAKCTADETCTKEGSSPAYCACGTSGQCKANEKCGLVNRNLVCKCGNGQCRTSEVCMSDDTCVDPMAACVDQSEDCGLMATYCYQELYLPTMSLQCAKTCKLCPALCTDEETVCSLMSSYCTSSDPAWRLFLGNKCTKTCGYCS